MWKRRIGYAMWLLAAGLLWFFENNTGTKTVLAASILLPAYSIVCAWLNAKKVRPVLHLAEQCGEGQQMAAGCDLVGERLRGSCRTLIQVRQVNRMTGSGQTATVLYRGREEMLPIETTYCGMVGVSVEAIFVSDWFDLCSFRSTEKCFREIVVFPALYPVNVTRRETMQIGDEAFQTTRFGTGIEESLGVRPYRPGDPIRMIHWKLSGKLDQTLIRENGAPDRKPVLVLLELHCEAGEQEQNMHDCVKAMLSTVKSLVDEGTACLVCTGDSIERCEAMHVVSAHDLELIQREVLHRTFTPDAEYIGRLAAGIMPEMQGNEVVLFSTSLLTDAASIYQGKPVTLVVPQGAAYGPGSAEIVTCMLSETQPDLEIG